MISAQLPSDLLRWPSRCSQLGPHIVPKPRPLFEPPLFRTSRGAISPVMSSGRSIRQPAATSADLPTNRPAMTSQPSSDLCVGVTTHDPDPDLFSVFERQRAWPLLSVPDHDHILPRPTNTPSASRCLPNPQPQPASLPAPPPPTPPEP